MSEQFIAKELHCEGMFLLNGLGLGLQLSDSKQVWFG